ncbi:MAG: hypothetical protein JWR84_1340 [Caulobacter sp.]|nr:hypothetical protein [Caulobacter sp.]
MLIHKVVQVSANILQLPGGAALLEIAALGEVSTTGWSHPRCAPVFYVRPPADGIWDFEFQADPPTGIVAPLIRPVGALYLGSAPDWCKGVRVHAATNAIEDAARLVERLETASQPGPVAASAARVIVRQTLATYEDSIQPTGTIHWKNDGPFGTPMPHVEMKKLHHGLVLTIEGPDEDKIRDCISKAVAAGLIAAIVAAAAGGGGALGAAISAALAALEQCLGDGFSVRVNDLSHWIYWDV